MRGSISKPGKWDVGPQLFNYDWARVVAASMLLALGGCDGKTITRPDVEQFIVPRNFLEECLVRSSLDRSLEPNFNSMVAESTVFVRALPTKNPNETLDMLTVPVQGYGSAIAVFSSKEALLHGLGDGPYMGLLGRDLFAKSGSLPIVMNFGQLPTVVWSEEGKARVTNAPPSAGCQSLLPNRAPA